MSLWRRALLAGLPAAGCVSTIPQDRVCPSFPLAEGEIWVGQASCAGALVLGGEGRPGDLLLANSKIHALVRHPLDALSFPGVGGGGLVDLAPLGARDPLIEALPLVGGGALRVDAMEVEADRVWLSGVVVDLPDRPAEGAGRRGEVAWRIEPDRSEVVLEGAEGLWLHGRGSLRRRGDHLLGELALVHDGLVDEDLGGAMRLSAVTWLAVAEAGPALARWPGPKVRIAGEAPGAERLSLWRGDELLWRVPVEGPFDLEIPAEVTGVRGEATGHASSAELPPGPDLSLPVGAAGWITLQGRRPVGLWIDGAGPFALLPDSGRFPVGPGAKVLRMQAGPADQPVTREVIVPDDGELRLTLPGLEPRDTRGWVPWVPGVRGERSRLWRGRDVEALAWATAIGARYAVVSPEDDVAAAPAQSTLTPWLRARSGLTVTTGAGGGTLWVWPFPEAPRQAGHGALPPGLAPADLVDRALGGVDSGRLAVVDLALLDALGAPSELRRRPQAVRLGPTANPAVDWRPWFDWLDRGANLAAVGPLGWAKTASDEEVTHADVERAVLLGQTVATTGPLLRLEVNGAGPGEIARRGPALRVAAEVLGGPEFKEVVLLGSGGVELARLVPGAPASTVPLPASDWLIATVRDEASGAWAVTSAVWLAPP